MMRLNSPLGELKKRLLDWPMATEFEHHLIQDCAADEGKNDADGDRLKQGDPPGC
jgi:hypothetical protein